MTFWRFQAPDSAIAGPLASGHDPLLMTLSIVIACFSGLTALMLVDRMLDSHSGAARSLWLWGGAVTMGLGIWSLHFTGMLAFPCSHRCQSASGSG